MASKPVKLQRPDSGHRVQSLLKGHGRQPSLEIVPHRRERNIRLIV